MCRSRSRALTSQERVAVAERVRAPLPPAPVRAWSSVTMKGRAWGSPRRKLRRWSASMVPWAAVATGREVSRSIPKSCGKTTLQADASFTASPASWPAARRTPRLAEVTCTFRPRSPRTSWTRARAAQASCWPVEASTAARNSGVPIRGRGVVGLPVRLAMAVSREAATSRSCSALSFHLSSRRFPLRRLTRLATRRHAAEGSLGRSREPRLRGGLLPSEKRCCAGAPRRPASMGDHCSSASPAKARSSRNVAPPSTDKKHFPYFPMSSASRRYPTPEDRNCGAIFLPELTSQYGNQSPSLCGARITSMRPSAGASHHSDVA
mmetsp:Transcript_31366/g.91211  ORF Transcript_31366/g.91211 Transcript_31366/m.91211 type:complete len:322 (+) Transcript_31366:279-1244(+)